MVRAAGALALVAALLAGCAGAPKVLQMDPHPKGRGEAVFFPPPPEVPRYLFAGELLGEANFVDASARGQDRLRDALRWVAGLTGEDAPQGLLRPQSGATDGNGRVLVTDASRQAVQVFDPVQGFLTWEVAGGLARFRTPVGIALAPDGRAFVADADLGFVVELDAKGTPLRAIGQGAFTRPTGVAHDPATGRLFVSDTHAHDIKVFGPDGRLERTVGRRGEGDGEFNFPTHLAFARGELYVSDTMNSRVQVLADGGQRHRLTVGARGLYVGNLVRPKGVAVDGDGNIYVIESYYDHLLVYDRQGRFLMSIGGLGREAGQFYLPAGVWTDTKNRVFVADMFNGRVVVLQFLGGDGNGA